MLETQSLGDDKLAWVEVVGLLAEGLLVLVLLAVNLGGDLAVVSEQLVEVLWAENVDLGEQQLALDEWCLGVFKDGPDWDEILELAACLLNNTVLAGEDNGHAGEILDFGVADDQRVNVEAAGGKNARDARQNTWLVLDKAVEDVTFWWCLRWCWSLVEDVGDGCLCRPCWRVLGWERRDAAVKSLVCEC